MLYRGSEIIREVSWVIFDEVHYMRDAERGVVWEESIILLPPEITLVFLSATLSNSREFALWVASLKNRVCHVVSTDYRPTPLQHYVFPVGGQGLYLAMDEWGDFKQHNYSQALTSVVPGFDPAAPAAPRSQVPETRRLNEMEDCARIISLLTERRWQPAIIFCFSRRECEGRALYLSNTDLCSQDDKTLIDQVFTNAMLGLTEADRTLPQIENILPLLRRGIGVHHSGLLPILKEVIELLFQEGLIKVLFATETFALGMGAFRL